MDQSLIQYYLKELAQIEEDCTEFAAMHPQVAGRLNLSNMNMGDPLVRQLLESVAFIAARLKRHMDGLSGEIVHSMLQLMCPYLIRPLPCMTVVNFKPYQNDMEPVASYIQKNTVLRVKTEDQISCQFSTPEEVALWPFELKTLWHGEIGKEVNVKIKSQERKILVMRLTSLKGKIKKDFSKSLQFYISGSLSRALAAIEAIALGIQEIRVTALDGSWGQVLPVSALKLKGFCDHEGRLVPSEYEVENTGAMVLEYLNFPHRFCFFEIDGIQCSAPTSGLEISLHLDTRAVEVVDLIKNHIKLNCVPVVNLYKRARVPIQINSKFNSDLEHLIPFDPAKVGPWDVQSIDQVRVLEKNSDISIPEYFSSIESSVSAPLYWVETRRERLGNSNAHASSVISFVDEQKYSRKVTSNSTGIVLLDLTCNNTKQPELIKVGQKVEAGAELSGYVCTVESAASLYADASLPHSNKISDLLRAFSLRGGRKKSEDAALANVRNYLKIHHRTHSSFALGQLESIRKIDQTVVALPVKLDQSGSTIKAGLRYDIYFDEKKDTGEGKYFLGKIIKKILLQLSDIGAVQEIWLHHKVWGTVYVD